MLTAKRHRLPGCSPGSPVPAGPKIRGLEKGRSDGVDCDYPNVALCCHHCVHRPWNGVLNVCHRHAVGYSHLYRGRRRMYQHRKGVLGRLPPPLQGTNELH
jgi:hypothetical protein